jgi:hypothetical protein
MNIFTIIIFFKFHILNNKFDRRKNYQYLADKSINFNIKFGINIKLY